MEDQLKQLENRMDERDQKFDRHLEIYANNGKESKRVADVLEVLVETNKGQDEKIQEIKDWAENHGKAEKAYQDEVTKHFELDGLYQKGIDEKWEKMEERWKRMEPIVTGKETTEKVFNFTGKVFYAVGKFVIFSAAFWGAYLAIKNNLFK